MMTLLFLNGVPLRGSILIISGGNKFICLRCELIVYQPARTFKIYKSQTPGEQLYLAHRDRNITL